MESKINGLRFISGVNTCAYQKGVFCRFLRVARFGSQYICALYEKPVYDENGYLTRLEDCLKEFGENDES